MTAHAAFLRSPSQGFSSFLILATVLCNVLVCGALLPHAPTGSMRRLAGHRTAPRCRRRRRLGPNRLPGSPAPPPPQPCRASATFAAARASAHRGRGDPDGHLTHRHLPGGARLSFRPVSGEGQGPTRPFSCVHLPPPSPLPALPSPRPPAPACLLQVGTGIPTPRLTGPPLARCGRFFPYIAVSFPESLVSSPSGVFLWLPDSGLEPSENARRSRSDV